MKSASGKVCKNCPRCGKNLTSSAMSKHLKQAHGEEIAREQRRAAELAAGSFAQLVSKQAEKPEKIQPGKQLDGDETAAEKPMTSVGALASSITEFIGNKFNELINSMSWLQQGQTNFVFVGRLFGMVDLLRHFKSWSEFMQVVNALPWEKVEACDEFAELLHRLPLLPVSCASRRLSCTARRKRAQRSATGAPPSCTPTGATTTAAARARTARSSKARSSSATSKRNRDLVSGPAKLVHCRAAARASLSGLARSSSTGT